jgi:hypothetical protein
MATDLPSYNDGDEDTPSPSESQTGSNSDTDVDPAGQLRVVDVMYVNRDDPGEEKKVGYVVALVNEGPALVGQKFAVSLKFLDAGGETVGSHHFYVVYEMPSGATTYMDGRTDRTDDVAAVEVDIAHAESRSPHQELWMDIDDTTLRVYEDEGIQKIAGTITNSLSVAISGYSLYCGAWSDGRLIDSARGFSGWPGIPDGEVPPGESVNWDTHTGGLGFGDFDCIAVVRPMTG